MEVECITCYNFMLVALSSWFLAGIEHHTNLNLITVPFEFTETTNKEKKQVR